MFMDIISWNSSLQAYGILMVTTSFLDLQYWHHPAYLRQGGGGGGGWRSGGVRSHRGTLRKIAGEWRCQGHRTWSACARTRVRLPYAKSATGHKTHAPCGPVLSSGFATLRDPRGAITAPWTEALRNLGFVIGVTNTP